MLSVKMLHELAEEFLNVYIKSGNELEKIIDEKKLSPAKIIEHAKKLRSEAFESISSKKEEFQKQFDIKLRDLKKEIKRQKKIKVEKNQEFYYEMDMLSKRFNLDVPHRDSILERIFEEYDEAIELGENNFIYFVENYIFNSSYFFGKNAHDFREKIEKNQMNRLDKKTVMNFESVQNLQEFNDQLSLIKDDIDSVHKLFITLNREFPFNVKGLFEISNKNISKFDVEMLSRITH